MIVSGKETANGTYSYMEHELWPQVRWQVATWAREGGEQMQKKCRRGVQRSTRGQQDLHDQMELWKGGMYKADVDQFILA